jgi:hypothetical protein
MNWFDVLFVVMLLYLFLPIVMTTWYKFLRIRSVFLVNIGIAFVCLLLLYFVYDLPKTNKDIGAILMLLSPSIFLILFKMLDFISMKVNKRPFVIPNKHVMEPWEKFNFLDIVCFLALLIIPLGLPMLLRDLLMANF